MTATSTPRPTLTGTQSFITAEVARTLLPTRAYGAHKWGVGGLIVVAGSPIYTGAALLSTRAAARSGAGIVQLATGRGVIATIASSVPEITHIILPETDSPSAARRALDELSEHLEKASALLIGPGLGRDDNARELLSALFGLGTRKEAERRGIGFAPVTPSAETAVTASTSPLFAREDLPIVVDADALNWLADQESWWESLPAGRLVLTPHPGELSRLTGKETDALTADPITAAEEAAKLWKQTVVFKYGHTVVTDGETTFVADDAPTSLATAGTGDILAGTIASFLAQGLTALHAASLAVHVGAAAARRVETRFGTLGLLASDLPEAIAEELHALAQN